MTNKTYKKPGPKTGGSRVKMACPHVLPAMRERIDAYCRDVESSYQEFYRSAFEDRLTLHEVHGLTEKADG